MPFAPGQNGKGELEGLPKGKVKHSSFWKRKRPSRDKTRPAFAKERLNVQQTNALRKKVAESHHHTPRSPQKRARIEAAVDLPCDVSPADAEPFAEPFPVAEPLSTVELMPRALRSSEKTVRKNDGKYTPSFLKRRRVAGPQQSPEAHQD